MPGWRISASPTPAAPSTRSSRVGRDLGGGSRTNGASLMELRGPFDGFVEKAVRATSTCLIMADHNRYSVDAGAAGRMVLVRSHAERIVVLFNRHGRGRASSPSSGATRSSTIPGTICRFWVKKPGALRNGAPFKDWDLPPALAQVRTKLKQHTDGDRQFVKVLGAVLDHGLARSKPPAPKRSRPGHRQRRRDLDCRRTAASAASTTQHHHARCIAPEDRTSGRLWPLRQHKEGRLMERHEILERYERAQAIRHSAPASMRSPARPGPSAMRFIPSLPV